MAQSATSPVDPTRKEHASSPAARGAEEFRPGFRFSLLDGAVLVCGALGAFAVARVSIELALLGVVAVLHFFLFCNVFRVSRPLELLWSAIFLACVGVRALADVSWFVLGGGVLAATVFVVWRQIREDSYHGVLWRRLNPQLPAWWKTGGRR